MDHQQATQAPAFVIPQRTFTNAVGEQIKITYIPLTKLDALEVEYTAIGVVMSSLEGTLAMMTSESKGADTDWATISKAVRSLRDSLPFATLRFLGEKLLRGAVVEARGQMHRCETLAGCNYFDDRFDEFVLAIFWGLDVSFPRLFSLARATLARIAAAARPGAAAEETLNDVSTTEQPSSSQ